MTPASMLIFGEGLCFLGVGKVEINVTDEVGQGGDKEGQAEEVGEAW